MSRKYSNSSMTQMRQHEAGYERLGSRRSSELVWKQSTHSSTDSPYFSGSPAGIRRPQQLIEGATGLLSGRRESIIPHTGICKDVITPDSENTPVDKQRSGIYHKVAVSKSTSSASDSSNTSNSTTSSANILTTTSGDSFRGSGMSGSLNGIATGIPPKVIRHSLGREAIRPSEVLKTNSVAKRQTS